MPKELRGCGTIAAYRRHQRHGEKPCKKCRSEYNRLRRERDSQSDDAYAYTGTWIKRNGIMIPVERS